MRQRTYRDGLLTKSIKDEVTTLRHYLDNIQDDWLRNGLFPLNEPGEFDYNNAYEVTRVSLDELIVITTGNHRLRWINVA